MAYGDLTSLGTTTELPANVGVNAGSSINNFIFSFGGRTGSSTYTNDIAGYSIGDEGGLTGLGTTLNLPRSLGYIQAASARNYIYVMGGYDGSTLYDDILGYAVDESGGISHLGDMGSLTATTISVCAVGCGNFIYGMGGVTTDEISTIDGYSVATNGTLTDLNISETLTLARRDATGASVGSFVYCFGGEIASNTSTDRIDGYKVETDGSLTDLEISATLGTAITRPGCISCGRYIYLLGGINGTTWLDTIKCFYVETDGRLSSVSLTGSPKLSTTRSPSATGGYNNFIYTLGGTPSSGNYSKVINGFSVKLPSDESGVSVGTSPMLVGM
jgi:hypothetical protein